MGSLGGARWDASSYPGTAGRLRSSIDWAFGGTICLEASEDCRGAAGTGGALESPDGLELSLSVEALKRIGAWFPRTSESVRPEIMVAFGASSLTIVRVATRGPLGGVNIALV